MNLLTTFLEFKSIKLTNPSTPEVAKYKPSYENALLDTKSMLYTDIKI